MQVAAVRIIKRYGAVSLLSGGVLVFFCLSYVNNYWISNHPPVFFLACAVPPGLYLWLKTCRMEHVLTVHALLLLLFELPLPGAVWYLMNATGAQWGDSFYDLTCFLFCFCWGLLAAYYLLVLFRMPEFCCRTGSAVIGWLLVMPLVFYCSFDLNSMLVCWYNHRHGFISGEQFWTNPEIRGALLGFGLRSLFVLVCFYFISGAIPHAPVPRRLRKAAYVFCGSGIFAAVLAGISLKPWNAVYLRNYDYFTQFAAAMAERRNPLDSPGCRVDDRSNGGLYFLIVGESHDYDTSMMLARRYDTLWGKVSKDPDYIVFPEVYSWEKRRDSGFTGDSEYSLCHLFTNASKQVDYRYLYRNPNLNDVAKKCGYKTLWVSNLGDYGIFARIQTFLSDQADFRIINETGAFDGKYDRTGFQVDNELPPLLRRLYDSGELDRRRSFMLLQPMGPHFDKMVFPDGFRERYPELSEYEAGVLYYENVLERIFSVLASFPETRAVVYCSDHSWERKCEYKLTMFVYLSPTLQRENPGLKQKLGGCARRKFMNCRIYDLFLEIMNISVEGCPPEDISGRAGEDCVKF